MRRFLAVLLVAAATASTAHAAFPGANGSIAFEGLRGTARPGGIFLLNGSAVTALTANKDAWSRQDDPAFSPNGRDVAYVIGRDIWIASPAFAPRQVTKGANTDHDPAFSPDGKRIVFERGGDLHVIGIDGKGLAKITADAVGSEYQPAWSPDGKKIAYTRSGCAPDDESGSCIWTINADGSGAVLLTHLDTPPECPENKLPGYYNRRHSSEAKWSPDGRKIVFTGYFNICTDQGGGSDIWTMNPDGSGMVDLIGDSGTRDRQPVWSPDGKSIVFVSNRGENTELLYSMPATGGAIVPLTSGSQNYDEDPDWGPAPRCDVPKLKGLRLTAARKRITGYGCKLGKVSKKKGKKGRVLKQSPAAGTVRPQNTKVSVTVGR